MAKVKDGFYKQTAEAIGSDLHVLLAGGGSKALSDFATTSGVVTALGTNGNYVTWTKNGTANNLTVPYATKAGTLDCFTRRATADCTWGTLIASNGYAPIYWGNSASGGGIGFSDKDGQTFMQIDGDYYAQEGAYRVWHAGNLTKVSQLTNDAGYVTGGPYLPLSGGSMTDAATIKFPANGGIIQTTATTHNAAAAISWYKGASKDANYNYSAQIGWYNMGDTDGAMYLIPNPQNVEPWGGSVGLYISKNILKWNNQGIIHSGNIGSQSVNYATSAGNADTLDFKHASDIYGYVEPYDLNNVIKSDGIATSYYDYATSASVVNQPLGDKVSDARGIVTFGHGYPFQLSWRYNNAGSLYARTKYGSSWNSWVRIATASDIPTVTNYYWANVPISATSNAATSPTFANATTTGLLTVSTGGNHCGIKAGSTYINSINGDLIFQNNSAIRFGGDSWDYNVWAGLKYVHSSKTISLGLADGTHFTANTAQSGGTMQFPGISNFILNGTVRIVPQLGSYQEGIRIQPKDNWSMIMLLGPDTTAAASGSSAKSWGIFNNNGNLYINRSNSSNSTGYELCNVSGNWGIGTISPAHKLHVSGDLAASVIYANREGSQNSGGISLYYNTAPDMYGIMFRGTANSGKYGSVTGDWATYFTMNDDTTRGWIFKRGSTNVASISGGGIITANHLDLRGSTTDTMTYTSTNPCIVFSENGGQGVKLLYSDYDSYRAPAGLKVIGEQGGEWFEVVGTIYSGGFYHNSYGSNAYVLTAGGSAAKIADLSVNYATTAGDSDKLDGLHWTSFGRWYGDASTDSTAKDVASTSTADFFAKIHATSGLFNSRFGAMRGSWWYAGNTQLDTGVGTLEMAGTAVLNLGSYADTTDTYKSLLFLDQGGRLWSYTANETAVKQWSRYVKTTDKIANASWADGAGNADTIDNYHASSLWRSDGATWNPSANITMTPTSNGQEWSFDFRDKGSYTGSYWHVWDESKSTLLKVDADSGKVSAPYGFVGNLTGSCTGSAGSVAWSNITGKPSVAIQQAVNDFVHSSNEWTVVPSGYSGTLWLNYRTTGGTNGNITEYNFGNGKGGNLATISNGQFSGNAATATYATTAGSAPASDVYSWAKAATKPTYTWDEISNKPTSFTPSSHTHSSLANDTTTTFGSYNMQYKQLSGDFDGNSGWSHYLVFNHGQGDTYYHYNVAFPFWGPPKYKRQTGDASKVTSWYTILSTENYTDYTVKKDGTGATGTWGINITGSAGSVAWGNVTGKPTFFSGNYNDLTNKPTIPDTSGFVTLTTAQTITGAKTFNTTITFGQSDSYGIRTSTDNYGRIGESSKRFYQCYVKNSYSTNGFWEDSDERLKNIIKPVKVDLDELSKLRKIYYIWKNPKDDQSLQLGMIAQDVQKIYPELVSVDKETGYLSLAYDRLSVLALEAIDNIYLMIKDLKKENELLKARIEKLEKLL